MNLAGYVINAVLVEGQRVDDVCAAHGVSHSWLYELIGRYREHGEAELQPRSKRPRSSTKVPAAIEDEIVAVRKSLAEEAWMRGHTRSRSTCCADVEAEPGGGAVGDRCDHPALHRQRRHRGQRNVVTYDDSNVFIDRVGRINANTGDTDSAGLNAVDTVRSNVSAGPHCDDGCDDESIIQAEAGVFDEGDVAIDGHGNVVWAPDRGDGGSAADEDDDSLPGDTGDDEDADNAAEDESDDGDVSDPVEPPESRDEADSGVDPAQRPPGDSLVIGGDGYDDLGVRVEGQDQVVTYDDSNVVMGGVGDVNAQIGDSDTGGTVTMGTVDSEVHGGNSR